MAVGCESHQSRWPSCEVSRPCICVSGIMTARVQAGGWGSLIDLLNALHVDHIFMETCRRPPDELEAFRDLSPAIGVGLDVVDIKTTEIETPDNIARAIERAETVLGSGRIRYVHPDCGFRIQPHPVCGGKIRALVKSRNLFESV